MPNETNQPRPAEYLDRIRECQQKILDLKLNKPLEHAAIQALQQQLDQLTRQDG
jgi:hypothetical protein